MKPQTSAFCLIALLTLSACHSNSNPSSISSSVRVSGNERCLDLEKMMAKYEALPGDTGIHTQVTDITVTSGDNSSAFELDVIRDLYESDTVPLSKSYDGSKLTQNGCESIKITYKNGRADNYKITAFTEESVDLAFERSTDDATQNLSAADVVTFHRITDDTYETSFSTNIGYCESFSQNGQVIDPGISGTVQVVQTVSWANPLPSIAVSPEFMAKVQKAQSTSEPACLNVQKSQ